MLNEKLADEIRRDITAFSDPGTEVRVSNGRDLQWRQDRQLRTATLLRSTSGFPSIRYQGKEMTYQGFLASEAMADLRQLAQSILALLPDPSLWIDAPAFDKQKEARAESAAGLIRSQTTLPMQLPFGQTRVLFLHGDAGIGKTAALVSATHQQAREYLHGGTSTLLLYLNAQGKGLAQIEDVMARALQDMRARFTYHCVEALTRRGCIVPIIDGFDELIGPSSSREAMTNLSYFLAQLDGQGSMVASSRSSFIDHEMLHESARKFSIEHGLSYEIYFVDLKPWSEDQIHQYCARVADRSTQEYVDALLESPARELVRKPFYLSQLVRMRRANISIDSEGDIVSQIVSAMLDRESEKLRDARGGKLLSVEQHRKFCQEIAEEMWVLGKAELDCDSIKTIAELCADAFKLSPRDKKTFVDRACAHALLRNDPSGTRREFEHELFRFEFQASRIAEELTRNPDGMKEFFNRGELPQEVAKRLRQYNSFAPQTLVKVVEALNELVCSPVSDLFAKTNAGTIWAALIENRQDLPADLTFRGYYVRAQSIGVAKLARATFLDCYLDQLDLSHAHLTDCIFSASNLVRCIFHRKETSLAGTKLSFADIAGVVVRHGGRDSEVFDPDQIFQMITGLGAVFDDREVRANIPQLSEEAMELAAFAERFLQHCRTHYYFGPEDPWFIHYAKGNPQWARVRELLFDHSLAEDVKIDKSGPSTLLLRLKAAPDTILRARNPREKDNLSESAVNFWRDLIAVR